MVLAQVGDPPEAEPCAEKEDTMEPLRDSEDPDSPWRVVRNRRSAGMIHIPYFNVFENALRKRKTSPYLEGQLRNMSMLRGRARYFADKAENYPAIEWYRSLTKAADRRVRDLYWEGYFQMSRRVLLAPGLTEAFRKLRKENADSPRNDLKDLSEPNCEGALTHKSANRESSNTIVPREVLSEEACDGKQSERLTL